MKKTLQFLLLSICMLLAFAERSNAQTYFNVTNSSGTSVVNGVAVTVTHSGAVDVLSDCAQANPYWEGSDGSDAGSYTWSFATPVQSVRFHIDGADAGDDITFYINGVAYSLSGSEVANFGDACYCIDEMIVSGGELVVDPSLGDGSAIVTITPGGNINSVSLSSLGLGFGVENDMQFASSPTNTTPTFVSSTNTLTDCAGTTFDLKSLLHVNDADASQTETWSQSVAPNHGGTLTFTSATASSGSTDITPGGTLTYTPLSTYSGTETFTVQVSDGTATATKSFTATVNPTPVLTVTPTSQSVCNNANTNRQQ